MDKTENYDDLILIHWVFFTYRRKLKNIKRRDSLWRYLERKIKKK